MPNQPRCHGRLLVALCVRQCRSRLELVCLEMLPKIDRGACLMSTAQLSRGLIFGGRVEPLHRPNFVEGTISGPLIPYKQTNPILRSFSPHCEILHNSAFVHSRNESEILRRWPGRLIARPPFIQATYLTVLQSHMDLLCIEIELLSHKSKRRDGTSRLRSLIDIAHLEYYY